MSARRRVAAGLLVFSVCSALEAQVRATDAEGRAVVLPAPAARIVSLAPHVTELLYAAGAGERIVGAVAYSDYPPEARRIPRVGNAHGLDLEAIVAARPQLAVGWQSGNAPRQIERLRALGVPVYLTEPRTLADIPREIERLGELAGTGAHAAAAARTFRERHDTLSARHAGRAPVRVFYQVLDAGLYTVNGEHVISDVLRLCGARNVFADFPALAGPVALEAVIAAAPAVIIAGGTDAQWSFWRARWSRWPMLPAVRDGRLHFVSADLLHRHTPRLLDAAAQVCAVIEQARGSGGRRSRAPKHVGHVAGAVNDPRNHE